MNDAGEGQWGAGEVGEIGPLGDEEVADAHVGQHLHIRCHFCNYNLISNYIIVFNDYLFITGARHNERTINGPLKLMNTIVL